LHISAYAKVVYSQGHLTTHSLPWELWTNHCLLF